MHRASTLSAVLLSIPLAALAGCDGQSADDPAVLDQALSSPYGDLDEQDEAPAFGDSELTEPELSSEDAEADDGTLDSDPDVETAEGDTVTPPVHLRVLLTWGHLRPDPLATVDTDWSGTIQATGSALRLMRLVAFEGPGDHPVFPRPDIRTLGIVSVTRPHADGVLLDVIVHPVLNPTGGPVTLTFDAPTAGFSHTITFAPGAPPAGLVPVDDQGNAFAWQIFGPDHDGCAQGYLAGRWIEMGRVAGREVGRLKGRWMSSDGVLRGQLRGVYGERASGAQVFFAKVIDADGRFIGVLAGRYRANRFGGLYLGPGRTIEGAAMGHYFDGPAEGSRGFFAGRWALGCGAAEGEGGTLEDDEATPEPPAE